MKDTKFTHRYRNIAELDGIRGISIVLVLVCHSLIYLPGTANWYAVGTRCGSTGVTLFFVLSGYLITSLMIAEESRFGGISLSLFYWRRALRLMPAFWAFLAALISLSTIGILPIQSWNSLIASALYVRNLVGNGHETAHLWSLSLEEQFYVLWPVFIVLTRTAKRMRVPFCFIVILVVTAWRMYAENTNWFRHGQTYIRTDFRIDAPIFGCVLALFEANNRKKVHMMLSRVPYALATGICILFLVIWLFSSVDAYIPKGMTPTAVCFLGAGLIAVQPKLSSDVLLQTTFLGWMPLVFLGKISYGIYLWQQIFLGPSTPSLEIVRESPLLGVFLSFVVAIVSYYLVETPILRIKNSLFRRT